VNGGGEPIVLRGHEDWVTSASFSPDGARVATASLDRTARVWSADGAGTPIVLAGHRGEINAVAWSPDGKLLVTSSEDRTARVWGADGSGVKATLPSPGGAVLRAVWSPDGARIATASSDAVIRVWSADGKGNPIVIDGATPALALAFLGGDQIIMAVGADDVDRKWMIDTNELTKRLRQAHADCLPPDVWSFYIGPSARRRKLKASEVLAACERSHGREPALLEGKER
jgi:WD40 repeat protein